MASRKGREGIFTDSDNALGSKGGPFQEKGKGGRGPKPRSVGEEVTRERPYAQPEVYREKKIFKEWLFGTRIILALIFDQKVYCLGKCKLFFVELKGLLFALQ